MLQLHDVSPYVDTFVSSPEDRLTRRILLAEQEWRHGWVLEPPDPTEHAYVTERDHGFLRDDAHAGQNSTDRL